MRNVYLFRDLFNFLPICISLDWNGEINRVSAIERNPFCLFYVHQEQKYLKMSYP